MRPIPGKNIFSVPIGIVYVLSPAIQIKPEPAIVEEPVILLKENLQPKGPQAPPLFRKDVDLTRAEPEDPIRATYYQIPSWAGDKAKSLPEELKQVAEARPIWKKLSAERPDEPKLRQYADR